MAQAGNFNVRSYEEETAGTPAPIGWSNKKIRFLVQGGTFVVLLVTVLLVIIKSGPSERPIIPTKIESNIDATMDRTESRSGIVLTTKSDKPNSAAPRLGEGMYSLKRKEYNMVPYFENAYKDNSFLQYGFLRPFQAIIEPYKDMELSFYDSAVISPDSTFQLRICDSSNSCQIYSSSSNSLNFGCTAYAQLDMELTEYDKYENVLSVTTDKAICLHVRRDMRTLTQSDRDDFFDALYIIYSTDQTAGEAKYGSNFFGHMSFLQLHFYHGAMRNADHLHDGVGFLFQHIHLDSLLEKSLQSIDPSISMPYCEFSIDGEAGTLLPESIYMQPNTYGSVNRPSNGVYFSYTNDTFADLAIPDGRFSKLKAPFMNGKYQEYNSIYGYYRSAFNPSSSPYVSRSYYSSGTDFPTCSVDYELMEYTDMPTFLYQIGEAPHGRVHGVLGGIYGCDVLNPLLEQGYLSDEDALLSVCSSWIKTLGDLYRRNAISPSSGCTVDAKSAASSRCAYTCTDRSAIWEYLSTSSTFTAGGDGAEHAWLSFICTDTGNGGSMIFTGDHGESASILDPSFWSIHPRLDRLFQARLMSGGFADETWPTWEDAVSGAVDVCNNEYCYETYSGGWGFHEDCCYMHYEHDRLYNYKADDKTSFVGPSNRELWNMVDPRLTVGTYSATYVYDNFEWKHCSATDGYDLDNLLVELHASYINGLTAAN